MATRGEYCTVVDLLQAYLSNEGTSENALALKMIRAATGDINDLGGLVYWPTIETRRYDLPGPGYPSPWWAGERLPAARAPLVFDQPLAEVTTLTNGDDTTVSSAQYVLEPANEYPKTRLLFKRSATDYWKAASDGETRQVIDVAGVWTAHPDYANAWVSLTTLGGDINSSVTALTLGGTGAQAGELWKIDSEFIYAGAVAGTAASALVRGVNGSTAASHSTGATIYRWEYPANIALLCMQAAAAYYKLKSNPVGETVNIEGQVFVTPKDVRKYIETSLERLGKATVVTG